MSKLVRESINFERGADPKEKLGIGSPYKNPMPGLNSFVETELKDITELNFGDLDTAMNTARKKLMDMVLYKGMYQEFGDAIKSFGPGEYSRRTMVLKIQHEGEEKLLSVEFHTSNEYTSYYATMEEPINLTTGYSRSVKALVWRMRKKFREAWVTV